MNGYVFSPSENAFYVVTLKNDYLLASTWPVDGIEMKTEDVATFMGDTPEGKERGIGDNGLPCWINITS
ncbi:hypothetical protein ACQKDS_19000 [Serratia sp. NPDC078593]|uniref:hypothetical protein n=1 Tax=unclassified Serratia (in: enterobacteria) TaxID=2647522 RepID=UPI0037D2AEDE